MDERDVRELLSRAVESVEPGEDLSARAERRYRHRRTRGRVVTAAVVVLVVGVGVATAAVVGSDRSAGPVLGKPAAVDVRTFSSLAFVDANLGYGVASTRPDQVALAKTVDGARSWVPGAVMPKDTSFIALAPGGDGLVAWGQGPVYRTSDEGAHWERTIEAGVSDLVVSRDRIWAIAPATCSGDQTCHREVTISDDGGRTWTIGSLAQDIGALAASPPSGQVFAVEIPTSDVTRWEVSYTADGHSWTRHSTPCAASSGPHLAVGGDHLSLMLVCSVDAEDRVYVSSDRGASWQRTVALPQQGRVRALSPVEGTDASFVVGLSTAVGPGWPNGPLRYPVAGQWEWKTRPQPIGDVYAFAPVPGAGTYFAAATGIYFDSDRTGTRELRTAPQPLAQSGSRARTGG